MFTNMLTMGQVLPWIPSQSCMHVGTCGEGRNGAPAHRTILDEIVDKLGNLKQAMHDVHRGPYVPYCLNLRLNSPLASRLSFGTTAIVAEL